MRVEDLVIGKRYKIDGRGTEGVFNSVNPDTGGLEFKIEKSHPYIELEGLVRFRPVSIELITPIEDEQPEPTN